jgi:hypothetical protein
MLNTTDLTPDTLKLKYQLELGDSWYIFIANTNNMYYLVGQLFVYN